MRTPLSLVCASNRTIDRVPYLAIGCLLFLLKYALDWTIARQFFGQPWSPLNYLVWPNDRVLRIFDLGGPEQRFSLTMLLVSLPFICAGVTLTLYRLRAAGLPPALVLLFFVPLVNLLLFLVLVLLPTRQAEGDVVPVAEMARPGGPPTGDDGGWQRAIPANSPDSIRRPRGDDEESEIMRSPRSPRPFELLPFEPLRKAHRSIVRESHWRSGLVALAITVPLAVLGVVLGANVLESYGFSLFVGAPFALGMFSVLLFGFSRPKPLIACMTVALSALLLAGTAILLVALEGAICLIMAAPIAFALTIFGALVGYAIQARPWLSDHAPSILLALLFVLPALMAAESTNEPEPAVRAVATEVIVNAPPEKVWPHVLAFPPLPEPDDWFFQTGIAYPQRAEIRGTGAGAVRHCVFSTGTFVEPIEAWEAPNLLRFQVTEQPEPMEEWSPYPIHPAHLDHYLCSHRGQFELQPLPDGRTRLVGTTWYSNRMWPAVYWDRWSDYIIHRIHGRVLTHIQKLAEAP